MGDEDDEHRQDELEADDPDTAALFAYAEPTLTAVEVDLHLSLGDNESRSWKPDEVFAIALTGLFEAMLPALCTVESHVHTDGNLNFTRDLECKAPSIDRHGSYLVEKKVKERASNRVGRAFKHSIYGNSRSPSRASSRAQSRVSAALTTSVMAMKMAKLAFGKPSMGMESTVPFRINEWCDGADNMKAGSNVVDPYAAVSSRFSLASSRGTARTGRIPVDHHEIRRREEISRDIDTREGRDKMTARIQRKGELKLKLRSLADPTISFDREEYEAMKKTRDALMSRGKSRGGPESTASEPIALSLGISITGGRPLGTTTSRSNETTYRPEDYEGLHSELVIMDKKGELLVGENCHLVARKPRSELQHDMLQRNTIKPRIHVPSQQPESNEDVSPTKFTGAIDHCEPSPLTMSHQSPPRPPKMHDQPNPIFEGKAGTLQVYPKIELDPEKTPLTKGVKIIPPEPPVQALSATPVGLKDIVNPPSLAKSRQKATGSTLKQALSEDNANDLVEAQLNELMRPTDKPKQQKVGGTNRAYSGFANAVSSGQKSALTTTRTSRNESSGTAEQALPTKTHGVEKYHLQSSRLRTPAYGNRNDGMRVKIVGIAEGELMDDSQYLHHAVDLAASLSTPNKQSRAASLPKFASYVREFPLPPTGHIHVVSSDTATKLLSPLSSTKGFPFAALPSVIRGKR